MINRKIKVYIHGEEKEIDYSTTLNELSKGYQNQFVHPIILAKDNNSFKNLRETPTENSHIEFLDLSDMSANRVNFNALIFVTILAIKELYGHDVQIQVKHTIDKGLYIETSKQINRESIKKIVSKIKEIKEADLKIVKTNVKRLEAIRYFEKVGLNNKASVLKYSTNSYITLYKLDKLYDFFYSEMPPSTGVIGDFDVEYINNHGFVLLYPTYYTADKVKKYVHHAQLFDTFKEHYEWANIMDVATVSDLNKIISQGTASTLIKIDETIQTNKLLEIAKDIYSLKENLKIILIAGPSSSGKTTTSLKLINYLRSFGMKPRKISMDDYFVNREDTPKREDGTFDYECLEAIDIALFNKDISDLLAGKTIVGPKYNFLRGEKEFINEMTIQENELLVIEGIHALNPKILNNIPRSRKYKIYISPTTATNIDEHNRIATSDIRMLRRIVRDNRTRNYSVVNTLEMWSKVREGEELYIFPYQDEANVTFNSALLYELSVLKIYVEPLLYSVGAESKYYEEAKRLINMLKVFSPLSPDGIPDDSLLREFIGGSYFNVE